MQQLLTLSCLMFLITGCSKPQETVSGKEAYFCDVEEKRRFTQQEIDWRTQHAPWNLSRDFRTNLSWERECEGLDK